MPGRRSEGQGMNLRQTISNALTKLLLRIESEMARWIFWLDDDGRY